MPSAKRLGRTIGLALLVQGVLTPPVYAALLPPVTAPTFLATAAAHATSIRAALVLSLILSTITLGVALAVLPIARQHSERLAIGYVAVTALGMATMAAETIAFRNLLALSLEYAKPAAPRELLQSIGAVAYSTAIQTHFTNLLTGHGSLLLLYVILFRLALVPRVLAIAGVIAGVIGIADVAQPLLGSHFSFFWVLPAGLCLFALIARLVVKGLDDRPSPAPAVA